MKSLFTKKGIKIAVGLSALALTASVSAGLMTSANAVTVSAKDRTISLSTTATLKMVPDTIRYSFTLTNNAKTNNAAYQAVAKLGTDITAVLNRHNIKSEYISSSTIGMYPQYDYSNNTQTVTGYNASQNFEVILRDIKTAPTIINDVVNTGGDGITSGSSTAYVYDSSNNDEKLRALAISMAKKTASSYAKLAGSKLGSLQSLVEGSNYSSPAPAFYKADAAVAPGAPQASTAINVGSQTITLTISTVWNMV